MAGDDPAVQAGVAAGQQASALGRSQMQAATAVGKGSDAGQAGLYSPASAPLAGASVGLTANRIYVVRFVAPRNATITKLAFAVTTASGSDDPCDAGIYSGSLQSLLGSVGSGLGRLNAIGLRTLNLQAPVSLLAGAVYYTAFGAAAFGGTAASLVMTVCTPTLLNVFGSPGPYIEQSFQNVAGAPLPPSVTTAGGVTSCPYMALVE